jgi:acetylornithine deacetylase/succinyl-diaminopimelate desuccinylase-like protein
MQDVFHYIDKNQNNYLEQLFGFLRQPSISTQNLGVNECALMLMRMLKESGAETEIFQTAQHPIVTGQIRNPAASRTLLIYGHYDVQPPEPLNLWESPPFEPSIRNGRIYGRGVADNKGQLFAHIKATEAILRVRGKTSSNITFLFEGEEEIGSPDLAPFIQNHRDLLKADGCLVSDGSKHNSGRPTIFCGLKGILYLELHAKGANRDLHSMHAAMVPSPVWKLVHALASLKAQDGSVLIPKFYERVRKPTEAELQAVRKVPNLAADVRQKLEIEELLGGDDDYYYNMFFSPTCNIAGIEAGYTGPGAKTVLPCRAFAKIDFRLVPNQQPDEVFGQVKQQLEAQGFADIEVKKHSEFMPSRTPVDHPYVQLIAAAIRYATNQEPIIFPSMGGSGPDYLFTGVLGLPSVWLPLSPHDSNNHAPNENIHIEGLVEGIKIASTIIEWIGERW